MKRSLIMTVVVFLLALFPNASANSINAYDPYTQSPDLFRDENQTVYLTNLQRRSAGLPPLRWNRELTVSARWFSNDFVTNLMSTYGCGHQDSNGSYAGTRAAAFGYTEFVNAENAYCGSYYFSPESAVDGWMKSQGHHDNILNTTSNEIGLGIYKSSNNWTMYTQVFGKANAMPLIIENEKPSTTSPSVTVYQGSNNGSGEMTQMGQANWLMLSNEACFTDASWQPYSADQNWSLIPGSGWRSVYSQVMDNLGRTFHSSDSIYLGTSVPTSEISLEMLNQVQPTVTMYNLNRIGYSGMQFSPGWIADDSNPHFESLGGTLVRDSDTTAIGGTAAQLSPSTASSAWVWQWRGFPENHDYVAYFRLKTSDNSSTNTVISVNVDPGGAPSASLEIKGTDFRDRNQYQEFAIPFRYFTIDGGNSEFMRFSFHSHTNSTVWVDAVTIFTSSVPVQPTYTWSPPGGSYHGEGIWVRYSNDINNFSGFQNAITQAPLKISAQNVYLMAEVNKPSTEQLVQIDTPCSYTPASSDWLKNDPTEDGIRIWADTSGLAKGTYVQSLSIQYGSTSSITIPVTLKVVDYLHNHYIPVVAH